MQSHTTPSRRFSPFVWASTLLLLLTFGLRIWRAAHDTVWFDEGISIWMARTPLPEMFSQTAHDTFPPVFYLLLSGWRFLVGEEMLALKMLSAAFGTLTVAISIQIGREVAGKGNDRSWGWQIGLAGGLMVALAWPQIWASQEIRQYSLGTLLGAVALWAALRLFNRPESRWRAAMTLALSLGAGMLTLYLFGQVPLALNLAFVYVFLTSRRRWKLAGVWMLSQIVALLLFAPWIVYSWGAMRREIVGDHAGLWELANLYLSVIFAGAEADLGRYVLPRLIGVAALIAAGTAALITGRREQRNAWVLLISSAVMPVLLFFIMTLPVFGLYRPPPAGRYFVLLSTSVYVLLGWGAVALTRLPARSSFVSWVGRLAGIGLLAVVGGMLAWGTNRYYSGLQLRDDYLSLSATLETLRQPGDAVILNNDTDWPVFAYHYPDDATYVTQRTLESIRDAEYLLAPLIESNDGIWLVQNRFGAASDPGGYLRQRLEAGSRAWRHYAFPEAELWFYALTDARAAPDRLDQVGGWPHQFTRYDAPIADGVRLAGYTRLTPEVDAGDTLTIGVGWRVEAGVTGQWMAAVTVLGAGGDEIASTLVTLDGSAGDHFTPVEIFIPPGAPTGRAGVILLAGPNYIPLTAVTVSPTGWVEIGSSELPGSATALEIRYGDGIVLKAAQLPDRVTWQPGESIPLTLYWQPVAAVPERYKVFVHLIGEQVNPATGNMLWGQQDQEPQGGTTQTTRWRPGETIPDDYLITIGDTVPPGHYTLQTGLYPLLGGPRLPAADQTGKSLRDSVIIFELEITP